MENYTKEKQILFDVNPFLSVWKSSRVEGSGGDRKGADVPRLRLTPRLVGTHRYRDRVRQGMGGEGPSQLAAKAPTPLSRLKVKQTRGFCGCPCVGLRAGWHRLASGSGGRGRQCGEKPTEHCWGLSFFCFL